MNVLQSAQYAKSLTEYANVQYTNSAMQYANGVILCNMGKGHLVWYYVQYGKYSVCYFAIGGIVCSQNGQLYNMGSAYRVGLVLERERVCKTLTVKELYKIL